MRGQLVIAPTGPMPYVILDVQEAEAGGHGPNCAVLICGYVHRVVWLPVDWRRYG